MMIDVPPQDSPEFGLLHIDEVYVAHDGPKFFCAINRSGRRYLVLAVDENEHSDFYLYLPVSDERFAQIRSGSIDLRTAFQEPEDDYLYFVEANYEEDYTYVSGFLAREGKPDHFPAEGVRLTLPTTTRPQFEAESIVTEAVRENRTLVALEVDSPSLRTEYPMRSFTKIGRALQDTIDALAQEELGEATSRGRVSDRVLSDAELAFVESRAASFVFVLAPHIGEALIEPPLAGAAVRRLVELLKVGHEDDDVLRSALGGHSQRTRSTFRRFLEALSDDGTGLSLHVADPAGELRTGALSRALVRNALTFLRASDKSVSVVTLDDVYLIGGNVRTRNFEVRDVATDQRYSGKIDPDAVDEVDGLTLGEQKHYRVTIQVETTDTGGDKPTVENRLLSITSRDPGASP